MNERPLVSIALCTYNGEKYIGWQLDSILCQTYEHLEIVIVDDCSTDDTFNIISAYAANDRRIKCFKNEINLGFNKNFERAIELTTGQFIALSDQDDVWMPIKIELLLNNIADNWLVFSNSSYINEFNEVIAGNLLNKYNPALHGYKGMLLANFITGHTVLFKRQFVKYFLPVPQQGFYDWWIAFVALYHQKITFVDEALTQYRVHKASVMQKRLNAGRLKAEEDKTIDTMLSAFAAYKHLNKHDEIFITRLKNAYRLNLSRQGTIPLCRIIYKHYAGLFPYQKKRKGLSLLNFALKYTRKVKN